MNYYLQVLTDDVSLVIDEMSNTYYHFRKDDIIEIFYSHSELIIIKVEGESSEIFNMKSPKFLTGKASKKNLAIASLILTKNCADITEMILREKKLNQLGI